MPQIERSALVFYSARQMFELVNDVPRYPEFLPGCAKAQILQQSADQMLAKLEVKKSRYQSGVYHPKYASDQFANSNAIGVRPF